MQQLLHPQILYSVRLESQCCAIDLPLEAAQCWLLCCIYAICVVAADMCILRKLGRE